MHIIIAHLIFIPCGAMVNIFVIELLLSSAKTILSSIISYSINLSSVCPSAISASLSRVFPIRLSTNNTV